MSLILYPNAATTPDAVAFLSHSPGIWEIHGQIPSTHRSRCRLHDRSGKTGIGRAEIGFSPDAEHVTGHIFGSFRAVFEDWT